MTQPLNPSMAYDSHHQSERLVPIDLSPRLLPALSMNLIHHPEKVLKFHKNHWAQGGKVQARERNLGIILLSQVRKAVRITRPGQASGPHRVLDPLPEFLLQWAGGGPEKLQL